MTICCGHLRSMTIANQKLALQIKQTALKCLHVSLIANWALGTQQPNWIKRRDTSQQPYLFFCFLYSVFNHLTLSHLHHHELRVPFLIFSLSNCLITHLDSACSCVSLSMCVCVCPAPPPETAFAFTPNIRYSWLRVHRACGNFQRHYAVLGITSRIQPAGANSCE